MKAWTGIFNILAVIVLMFILISNIYVYKTLNRDFDQKRLELAVDYATEAAFKTTIESNDAGLDYSDMNRININPGNCLDTFETMMCFNYGMAASELNKDMIADSIAAMVLSTKDGYYIQQLVYDTPRDDTTGAQYSLHWSVKIPYMVVKSNYSYVVNISQKLYTRMDKDWVAENLLELGESPIVGDLTESEALRAINEMITDSIVNEMNIKSLNGEGFDYNFNLPSTTTKYGVNPIKGPGLFVIVHNPRFASYEKISALSVSGYRVVDRVNVVGYVKDGSKLYCLDGQLPSGEINVYGGYKVERYFESMESAAKMGYYPDFDLLANSTTKSY